MSLIICSFSVRPKQGTQVGVVLSYKIIHNASEIFYNIASYQVVDSKNPLPLFQSNEVRATTSLRGRCSESTSGKVRRRRRPIAPGTRCTWSYAGRAYVYIKIRSRTKLRPINRTKEKLLLTYEARLLP